MKANYFATLGLIALMVPAVSLAQGQAPKKKQGLIRKVDDNVSGQGYGMGGCGLGSIVFGEEKGFIQIVAVTLNATGIQTFAISTGTSNCGESGKIVRTNQFIEVNRIALENDLSRGQGESLTSLSSLMECQNTSFAQDMRAEYNQVKSQSNAVTAEQLQQLAAKSCKI